MRDAEGYLEVSVVTLSKKFSHLSRQNDFQSSTQLGEEGIVYLSGIFDKTSLAELITKDVWMDFLHKVIEGNELMGSYRNLLWHQKSLVNDWILVDYRLAVPAQLR